MRAGGAAQCAIGEGHDRGDQHDVEIPEVINPSLPIYHVGPVDDTEDDIPNLIAAVGRQTDRVVTVAVRNLDTNELTDAHVNVVMFNPSPTV